MAATRAAPRRAAPESTGADFPFPFPPSPFESPRIPFLSAGLSRFHSEMRDHRWLRARARGYLTGNKSSSSMKCSSK